MAVANTRLSNRLRVSYLLCKRVFSTLHHYSLLQAIIDISRTELGLDEVPIKLRDGINTGNSNGRDRSKEDGVPESPEYDEIKAKRNDHGGKQ